MLFNSFTFAVFLTIVFVLYWSVLRWGIRARNIFLLCSSYVFYGWWDWRFLSLIAFSSIVDYAAGLGIAGSSSARGRRFCLVVSLATNLGLLCVFKYLNFFSDSFAQLLSAFGLQANPLSLKLVLPVGISFYTFQTLSYTIDVYRGKIRPTRDWVAFFAYVSFFPQLVAGPIERASNLLPQFMKQRSFDYATGVAGMRLILWGLFKKVVIADRCAVFANDVFLNYQSMHASQLVMGAVFFAFQIYGDFSGYSDIAIGTAKLLGFDLMVNFRKPYFSRDIAEFWRRWHISLTTWFRDYVYIPLGGSHCGRDKAVRNIFVVFLVSGFWHGANWTFLTWGVVNALCFLPLLLTNRNRRNLDEPAHGHLWPSPREFLSTVSTFALVCLGWVFFRAEDPGHAGLFLWRIAADLLAHPGGPLVFLRHYLRQPVIWLLIAFVLAEWISRDGSPFHGIDWIPRPLRWIGYMAMGLAVGLSMTFHDAEEFIYFQF